MSNRIITEHDVFSVVVEHTQRIEARVDADTLIKEFDAEWKQFLRGDEPTNDDKYEFVKETLDIIGTEEFFDPGASPWVVSHRADDDWDVRVSA
jgi:hypothetical protein